MKSLPPNVNRYQRTPSFTQESIPKGLLEEHQTKKGVWGLIQIEEGSLDYYIQTTPIKHFTLTPDSPGVVEPEQLHFVKPVGSVKFFVEFYK